VGMVDDAREGAGIPDRERRRAAPEGVPTITYRPLSDDESSDDEEMRALYRKYMPKIDFRNNQYS